MKKILPVLLAIILISVWGVRFYFINRDIDIPVVQIFQKGTEVPVGKDFFIGSDEDMDGYTVTVLNADLISAEDFLRHYDVEEAENVGNFTDYIYLVSYV